MHPPADVRSAAPWLLRVPESDHHRELHLLVLTIGVFLPERASGHDLPGMVWSVQGETGLHHPGGVQDFARHHRTKRGELGLRTGGEAVEPAKVWERRTRHPHQPPGLGLEAGDQFLRCGTRFDVPFEGVFAASDFNRRRRHGAVALEPVLLPCPVRVPFL